MIDSITLDNILPRAFAGMENDEPVKTSQVWLKRISFSRPGFYMVEAESGAGKSSMCSFIYGSRGDYSGDILFDGRSVRQIGTDEWCRLRQRAIAYLPQELMLFPELTVMDNIEIKNRLTRHKSERWILETLAALGIEKKAAVPAGQLSVGQQQRVAIVRALCQPFNFLLLDEPVSHLDERNNAAVARIIETEARENHAAVIATSVGNKIQLPFTTTVCL